MQNPVSYLKDHTESVLQLQTVRIGRTSGWYITTFVNGEAQTKRDG